MIRLPAAATAAAAVLTVSLASPALAGPATCAQIVGHQMPSIGSTLTVNLQAGEQVTVTAGSGSSAYSVEVGSTVAQCGFIYGGLSCAGHVFAAAVTGTYTFEKTGGVIADTLTCSAGAAPGGGGAQTPSSGAGSAQGQGATLAAGASVNAVGGAVNSALSGTSRTVTRNGLFFSTSGADTVYNGWVSLQGRSYSGAIDGESYELSFGTDFEIGMGKRLGLFLSMGQSDLNIGGVIVESDGVSFGPYVKMELGDRYSVTGYALFAQPDYTVGGTRYQADRRALGVTVNADYMIGNTEIVSYLGLSGFTEDHPAAGALVARDISSFTGSIGTRASFNAGAPFRPYLSLGADFMRFDDGINGTITHNTPRVGAGFIYDSGAGSLNMHINGGEILQGTDDVEVRVNYDLEF